MSMSPESFGAGASIALAALAVFAGVLLVAHAASSFPGHWKLARAEVRYEELARGRFGSVLELDALTNELRTTRTPAGSAKAAFVQMVQSQHTGIDSPRSTIRLVAAARDLRHALARSPADAYAWTRLAVATQRLGEEANAARALTMALTLAPTDVRLTPLQLDLALVLWPHLDATARRALDRRLAWARTRPDLKHVWLANSASALRERLAAYRRHYGGLD